MFTYLAVAILSYLIGSIPFGFIAGFLQGKDIRKVGSGNIGATNVLRVLGPLPAAAVFLLDLLKGTAAVGIATLWIGTPLGQVMGGGAAILGHSFPLFLGFRGGRGAATSLGVVLGVAPDLFLVGAIMAALIIGISRYVSLASIVTPLILTVLIYILKKPGEYFYAGIIVSTLIILKHIPNIRRLLSGTEPRIGEKANA